MGTRLNRKALNKFFSLPKALETKKLTQRKFFAKRRSAKRTSCQPRELKTKFLEAFQFQGLKTRLVPNASSRASQRIATAQTHQPQQGKKS